MCDPESSETDASEVMGSEDIHNGQNQEKDNSSESCQTKETQDHLLFKNYRHIQRIQV